MNRHITDPLAALKTNVALPFEQARAMPPEVYTTTKFHDAELEHIFGRQWFCVGRASSLAESAILSFGWLGKIA